MLKLIVFITILLFNHSECAKILCVFFVPSFSHQEFFIPITRELSLRGHEVVVITSHPYNDPSLINLTEIDISYLIDNYSGSGKMQSILSSKSKWSYEIFTNAYNFLCSMVDHVFNDENFKAIYNDSEQHFDLLLIQNSVPTFYSLQGRFKVPMISISSLGGLYTQHDSVGNINNPALYGDVIYQDFNTESLGSRLMRTCYYVWNTFFYYYHLLPREDEHAREYLGDNIPYLGDLEKNISMLFLNGNRLFNPIRPTVPTTLYLNGIHIKPIKKLSADFQKILDDAKNGVIYLSLGSNVKSSNLDKNEFDIIVHDVSELPYIVLWKWELDEFPGKPNNVIAKKWFPQQDILAHPNVKVFVTQGGLQSAEEAIVRGVPIVGMPFIADQPLNVKKLVEAGVAIEVDPVGLKRNLLKQAILEVAKNPKYKNKMKHLQSVFLDQPMNGLEQAVWWCEYVIRHNGTKSLRSPTADIPLYQYLLLDVIVVILVSLYLFYKILKNLMFLIVTKVLRRKKIKSN